MQKPKFSVFKYIESKKENYLFMENEFASNYVKMVFDCFADDLGHQKQELCQRLLRKCPTPLAIKRLTRVEKREICEWAPEMKRLFAAIDLGQAVTKSHEDIIGHAYSSVEVGQEMVARFQDEEQENICIACTDVHNDIIAWKVLFIGGGSECVLYPDKIFQYALQCSAHGIIMIHNHPTGDIRPSSQDDSFVRRLERGCDFVGINLIDFMIVGRDSYYSWQEDTAL